jgi:hypothetical protein
VDWNGQENFSLSCELWVETNDFNTKKNFLVRSKFSRVETSLKGDGLEAGFQDGRKFLRSLKRKRINKQPLATILNLTLTPHLILTPTLTLILTQTLISILKPSLKLPLIHPF